MKRKIILVHGGMLGGWCWDKVRPFLQVLTPTLTGLGERKHLSNPSIDLEVHINDIVNTIFYEDLDEVILVGHSYAGMVITGVADRIPQKIRKLIYLDALLPKDGESMFDIIPSEIVSYLLHSARGGWEVHPALPESYGVKEKWFLERCTPHPLKCFQQPLRLKGNSVEKVYIKCTQDGSLNLMLDRAKQMNIPYKLLDTGHLPMITDPQKLAELLKTI